jgi:exodeoxyribonuclease VII large subunit
MKNLQIKQYSVSQISNYIKSLLEDNFTYVKIKGEISGLKIHSSGHIYFNIKDEYAVLNAVCFKNIAGNLKALPKEGLEIIATGKITCYKQRSNYQILISNIEQAGEGALWLLYEKLKKQLQEKGYFDLKYKKPIKKIPHRIAVITSETGAVFQDICHRIKARYPCHIILFPTLVQGQGAEIDIANMINKVNEVEDPKLIPDTIILARGGGSIEDLWCFNEEIVATAIFNSKIPIISAIGHETDNSLADYVSDLRAPTPTAAAELATPLRTDLEQKILQLQHRISINLYKTLELLSNKLEYLILPLKEPSDLFFYYEQRLDDLAENLQQKMQNYYRNYEYKLININLTKSYLIAYLENKELILNNLINKLLQIKENIFTSKMIKLDNLNQLLEALNYKKVLNRGYAIIRDEQGKVLASIKKIKQQKELELEFSDGKDKVGLLEIN